MNIRFINTYKDGYGYRCKPDPFRFAWKCGKCKRGLILPSMHDENCKICGAKVEVIYAQRREYK